MTNQPGARLGAAAGGALLGGLATGGAGWGIQAGWVIGQGVFGLLAGGGEKTVVLDRVTEFRFTGSAFGAPIPTVDGARVVNGHLMYLKNIRAIRVEQTTGGKGLTGPETTTVGFRYIGDLGYILAEAPPEGMKILKVWGGVERDLLLDFTAAATPVAATLPNGAPATAHVRLHEGADPQEPDPTMQAELGIEDTSGFPRLVWLMLFDFPLGEGSQLNLPYPISALVSSVASDKKPATIIEGDREARLFGAVIRPDLGRLVVTGSDASSARSVTVVDLANKTVLASATYSGNTYDNYFKGVDAFGNVWFIERNTPVTDTDTLHKADGLTLQIIGSVVLEDQNSDALERIDTLVIGTPPQEFVLVEHSAGKLTVVYAPTLQPFSINLSIGSFTNSCGMTVDGEGRPWLAHHDGVDTTLTRVSALGATQEAHVISGEAGYHQVGYDPVTNSLVLAKESTGLLKWSLDDQAVTGTLLTNVRNVQATVYNGPDENGHYWFKNGDTSLKQIDIVSMTVLGTFTNTEWDGVGGFTIDNAIYDPVNRALVRNKQVQPAYQLFWFYLDRLDPGTILLRAVLERHSKRVGLDLATQVDASDRTEVVRGFLVEERRRKREQIDLLQPAYFFDAIEEDRGGGVKIVFPKRGSSPVASINFDDLGARPAGAPWRPPIDFHEDADRKLPEVLEISYADPALDYQISVQQAQRDAAAVISDEVDGKDFSALAFLQAESAQVVESILWTMYLDQIPLTFAMPRRFMIHSAADVLDLVGPTTTFRVKIKSKTDQKDGVIAVEAHFDEAPVYVSAASGGPAEGVLASEIKVLGASVGMIADAPAATEEIGTLGLQLGARRLTGTSFPGASILTSSDGESWASYAAIESGAEMLGGSATEALPDVNPAFTDRTSILKVRLWAGGSLPSFTEAQVLASRENGAVLVQSGTAWEWLQYADATLQADGVTWHLTTLLRGRNNTENHVGGHAAGDRVWFPTRSTLKFASLTTGALRSSRLYATVTLGLDATTGSLSEVAAIGRSIMPYAPWLKSIAPSAGGRTVTFERQDRRPPADMFWTAPLSETSENYDADIIADDGTVHLKVTTTASANGSAVTVADPPTLFIDDDDLAGVTLPATVELYQLSAEAVGPAGGGRGEKLTLSIS